MGETVGHAMLDCPLIGLDEVGQLQLWHGNEVGQEWNGLNASAPAGMVVANTRFHNKAVITLGVQRRNLSGESRRFYCRPELVKMQHSKSPKIIVDVPVSDLDHTPCRDPLIP